ncbi:DUF2232 domain-containing protein [Rhizobium sp. KVB221]|uniref:DUF2232 domain-containing protein n=1 Tax=Rhizobium setariae TaxID=2801340 RepID=A0A937CNY7_9HYPH|nr:DUF2232 domain-containing protein [Rhizobium setariae]MBL0371212.1 DUF2232 domain-containing protein [Rhizobium setariae]
MNAPKNPILIGIIAGLASAILLAAAGYASLFGVILIIAALASVFIAGLGYGLASSLAAVAAAAIATAIVYSNPMSFVSMGLMLFPAVVMSYLANLARPATELGGPDTAMAWYPLSDILLAAAILTAIATAVTLLLNSDIDAIYGILADTALGMVQEINPELPAGSVTKEQLVGVFQIALPLLQSLQMVIALFAGFYVAVRILTAAGHSARPREDVRVSLRMNRLSIGVFMGGILLMFGGAKIEVIGAALAGAAAGGYLLSGFAIIHNALRDKGWRMPGLILLYLLTLMLPIIPVLLVIAGGLANPRRAIALTPTKQTPTPTNHP